MLKWIVNMNTKLSSSRACTLSLWATSRPHSFMLQLFILRHHPGLPFIHDATRASLELATLLPQLPKDLELLICEIRPGSQVFLNLISLPYARSKYWTVVNRPCVCLLCLFCNTYRWTTLKWFLWLHIEIEKFKILRFMFLTLRF